MNIRNNKCELKRALDVKVIYPYTRDGKNMFKVCITFSTGETEFRHITLHQLNVYQTWVSSGQKKWDFSL